MAVVGEGHAGKRLLDVLTALPLFDSVFLQMQAQNVAVVHAHLASLEDEMVSEYDERGQTPHKTVALVSALSQMWILALYEVLRTWRQMVDELLSYRRGLDPIRGHPSVEEKRAKLGSKRGASYQSAVSEELLDTAYNEAFRKVERDSTYAQQLESALAAVTPVFGRIADLRVALAKHELPGIRGVRAYGTDHARIDVESRSLQWMVERKDGTSEPMSRGSLVQELLELRVD